ncbi:MAG: OadG family protein [Firmicutes bacterium]|nr:OadG family protein [Bacillota bacterium]
MSLREVLIRALSDTLMGMGTVFVILLLICFIISLFKFINKSEMKKAALVAQAAPEVPAADGMTAEAEEEDEAEIIAAIITAIMMAKQREGAEIAFEGPAAGMPEEPEYIVRSIKRRR